VFIEAKGDGGGGGDNWNTGAIIRAKLQSNHLVTNKPTSSFLQAGFLLVAQPTVSKH